VTLEDVEIFQVPATIVDESSDALREAGAEGYELFVLWTGVIANERFQVQRLYVPRQRSHKGEAGLHVRVGSDDLHQLNLWLYENHQILGVQVHTHPSEAFHSDTDDLYPIVTTLGGLSIVVPRFCHDGLFTDGTAVYRLGTTGWAEVENANHLLSVKDDGTS
jgi:hypothetical protein